MTVAIDIGQYQPTGTGANSAPSSLVPATIPRCLGETTAVVAQKEWKRPVTLVGDNNVECKVAVEVICPER